LFDADFRLKSSASQPRFVLEKLILSVCLGSLRKNSNDPGRVGP
jgi:hypothetical protein